LFLPVIAYTLSSTKLEIKAKQFLPASEGVRGEREEEGEREGTGGKREKRPKHCMHI
jgi:hypothetical protein